MAVDTDTLVDARIMEVLLVDATQILPEARLGDDLGATSLVMVELLVAIEETFGFTVPEVDSRRIVTVADLHKLVERLRQ